LPVCHITDRQRAYRAGRIERRSVISLACVPVADVDRAKAFYVGRVGFHVDHDHA